MNFSVWNYLPISASCGVKRYIIYIRSLLTKTSEAKFELIFSHGSVFIYNIDFVSICKRELNKHLIFLRLP